jgi:hypothetical protein
MYLQNLKRSAFNITPASVSGNINPWGGTSKWRPRGIIISAHDQAFLSWRNESESKTEGGEASLAARAGKRKFGHGLIALSPANVVTWRANEDSEVGLGAAGRRIQYEP